MITFNTVMNRAAMLVDFLCSIAVVNRLNKLGRVRVGQLSKLPNIVIKPDKERQIADSFMSLINLTTD